MVQTEIIAKYGIPGLVYEQKFCMMWNVKEDFPELAKVFINSIEINKEFKLVLYKAFTALRAAGLLHEIDTFNGCLQNRTTRGSAAPSLHSWAMAIDMNAADNKMQFKHVLDPYSQCGFSRAFIACMKAAGAFWGGDYSARYDPMHFSLYNG